MPISQELFDDHRVITIRGTLDARMIQQQRNVLEQIPASIDRPVVFDLSDIKFLDSSGIGFLVYVFKRIAPSQYPMAISGLKDQPLKTIKMLHIHRMIPCIDSIETFRLKPPRLPRGHRRAKLKSVITKLTANHRRRDSTK